MSAPGEPAGRAEDAVSLLTVPAPAKLNLFLHVTGRRADGYHELESLFVALDYGDALMLSRRADGAIVRLVDLPGIPAEADLAVRAARALQRETASPFGADIGVVKRIPQGAGLGGGSSDAASVLLGLNRLWGLRLPREALMRIGLELGADVPFFVFGVPALARGVGERLTAMTLPVSWAVVLHPAVGVPTAAIFAAPELTRNTPSAKMNIFSEGYGRNDLQAAAVARYPDIAAALDVLARQSISARMTGSGGSVFAVFPSEDQALAARAAVAVAAPGLQGFVARTLARHPLAAFA
jgi:4-diphosphocytidyl-2-C-methyl-D-erythritol kinase